MSLRTGSGQLLDQSGSDHNLLRPGLFGMLINIDHFEIVAAAQLFLANGPNVLDGAGGAGGGPVDEKAQKVMLGFRLRGQGFLERFDFVSFPGHHADPFPPGPQVEAHQHALGIGKVADDFPYGLGELPHQGGKGENLVSLGQLRDSCASRLLRCDTRRQGVLRKCASNWRTLAAISRFVPLHIAATPISTPGTARQRVPAGVFISVPQPTSRPRRRLSADRRRGCWPSHRGRVPPC